METAAVVAVGAVVYLMAGGGMLRLSERAGLNWMEHEASTVALLWPLVAVAGLLYLTIRLAQVCIWVGYGRRGPLPPPLRVRRGYGGGPLRVYWWWEDQ